MVMQTDLTYGHADIQRFWSKVTKGDGCWVWTGTLDKHGYGAFKVGGKMVIAHRFALILSGENIDGLFGCHGCDNPPCVRIGDGHVFVGTPLDNTRDMDAKGRRDPKRKGEGHPMVKLTEERVREIIERYRGGETQRSLSIAYGIGQMQISRIVRGARWGHLGGGSDKRGYNRVKAASAKATPELRESARRLRSDGATYEAIGKALDVSTGFAWKLVNND